MIGDWEAGREYSNRCSRPVASNDALDLATVQDAVADGFELLTEAPLWCFLPALWPVEHRAWARDERVRHGHSYSPGGDLVEVPWSANDYFEIEADYADLLRECDVRPRPPARVWLLRMPSGRGPLDRFLSVTARGWDRQGGQILADSAFVAHVATEVATLFGH